MLRKILSLAGLCFFMHFLATHEAFGQNLSKPGAIALIEAENQVTVKSGNASWKKGVPEMPLGIGNMVQTGQYSRAAIRLSPSSVARLDELTRAEIVCPAGESRKSAVNISCGALYIFSREKAREFDVLTPAAAGALRGTEFVVRVHQDGRAQFFMLDGEVVLSNALGSVVIHSGEQGEAEVGKPPRKTAMIEAKNVIQWVLYYPAVLDISDIGMRETEKQAVFESLAAYNKGDILGALKKYPSSYRPTTPSGRLYKAGVLLTVGRVDAAQVELQQVSPECHGRHALERMIAAVKFLDITEPASPETASEWLAESYYLQSKGCLEQARTAAKNATEKSPGFGYAWIRLAELEFCFGRTQRALEALQKGLALTPCNAQGHSLRGFLLSAQNSIRKSRESFDEAIRLDGALANAWLGKGLTKIREGHDEQGRLDLLAATVLEPNRSIFHSYLGKAFSQAGKADIAQRDLTRAKELEPNDPTPWLYSAIENKQHNRYNEAIDDLEKSVCLNDNRRIYRSRFLLDQDLSIRSTNLAAIYQNDGMWEQSIREAVLAVNADYTSAPAHLFLANSYNALRDPNRVLLRYETPWFNELLLSNLLSPVGGGPLSQFVSEQEYAKMFQQDGLGISSLTEYLGDGGLHEVSSQYGTFGNISYALDAEYYHGNGTRPNNKVNRFENYDTIKLQITPENTLFFQTKFEKLGTGDVLQRYNQSEVRQDTSALTTDFSETQDPGLLLFGLRHQWSPGNDTLLLAGRLANRQTLTSNSTTQTIITRDVSAFTEGLPCNDNDFNQPFENPQITDTLKKLVGMGRIQAINSAKLDFDYQADFETYTAEIQQIAIAGPNTLILGGRYQTGDFDTYARLTNHDADLDGLFDSPASSQQFDVGMHRKTVYAYDILHATDWLSLTGGVTFDSLTYPDNFRSLPINDQQRETSSVLPKAGIILQPFQNTVLRGCYAESLSGASFDESVCLEPTQVAGFTQAYRSLASESLVGSVAGSKFKILGLSLEQKLPTRTYLGVGFNRMQQNIDQTLGVFDFLNSMGNYPNEILPSSLGENDRYCERVYSANVNQLIGNCWSIGARYICTKSELTTNVPELNAALKSADPSDLPDLKNAAYSRLNSTLNQLGLFALYNHPRGFFTQAEANYYSQTNNGFDILRPGDTFWQFNLFGGYRFCRNQCEVGCGILNIGNVDYKLEPLNPYLDLPRNRTFVVRVKLTF